MSTITPPNINKNNNNDPITQTNPSPNLYQQGLEKNEANFDALTPISFIKRTAMVYPHRLATINGNIQYTWQQTYQRCYRFASALNKRGIGIGDTVSVLAPNISEVFELHFSVPMSGAVLNAINTRLEAHTIAYILKHGESKILLVDKEFGALARQVMQLLSHDTEVTLPLLVTIDDENFQQGEKVATLDYEALINEGSLDEPLNDIADEWQAIALNYTSGTTGNPKGVVYHHRGAYLNAISNILSWDMVKHPVYLWTLPMFHCNGWCFPWAIAATAGVSVSLRHVRADDIFNAIKQHSVTHFCAAPIVLNMMNNADETLKQGISHQVNVMTAGAAPPASVIENMQELGFQVTHTYGLTETYGPCVVCDWQQEWDELSPAEKAVKKSRQGVPTPLQADMMVADPITMQPVPKDGTTMGEIMLRGNIVMKGYLKHSSDSNNPFDQGWFHTGDIAVWHPDSYVDIKDRSKDIIISGGENISSIEVENVLYRHKDIEEVAVIAIPDEKWGEVPCAFVKLHDFSSLTEQDIIDYSREHLAHFKAPKRIIFTSIPKTSTGKVQKFLLRDQVK